MSSQILPNLIVQDAIAGDPDAARKMIDIEISAIRKSPHLDDEEKEYFIAQKVAVACAYDSAGSLQELQRNVTKAMGLSRPRGRQKNDIMADFAIALRIDEIMQTERISLKKAIDLLLQKKDPVLQPVRNTDFQNLKRIYRSLKTVVEERNSLVYDMMTDTAI